MKVVAFVGHHNSGKTTLIEQVAKELKRRGYKVGYLKHDPKGHGVTDKEGSDTYRIFKILEKVALVSPGRLTLWEKRKDDPLELAMEYFAGFDVVILEGWKSLKGIKKVVVGNLDVEGFKVNSKTPLEDIIFYILS